MTREVLAQLRSETENQLHAIWQMSLVGWVALADELHLRRNDREGAARVLAQHVLRQRGVLPTEGQSDGHYDDELQCCVDRMEYDFHLRMGHLYIAAGQCCDASQAIAYFTRIDPNVTVIKTSTGSRTDTRYTQESGRWSASCATAIPKSVI